jgi:Uma2 family endonuclease
MEVYQNLPEGTLAQLINNQIYMSPAPSTTHQSVLMEIADQLFNFAKKNKLGKVLPSPVDVYLNRKNAFQPDIIFIANDNMQHLKESGFYGAPDLVIEILSPATWHFDKGDKKDIYEQCGVKEYWMVDPIDKSTEGFYLKDNIFQPLPAEKEKITFKLFDYSIHF